MGELLSYPGEITRAMQMLAQDPRTVFIGQNVRYGGAVAIRETLEGIPECQKLEMPVAEELQLGMCIGLSLEGYLPVPIFPRMDFLLRAADQLVNHLDKMEEMSAGRFRPKVIIRTGVGATSPLDPGPQHSQDHTDALTVLLTNIDVIRLESAAEIVPAYRVALESPRSTILVELGDLMRPA